MKSIKSFWWWLLLLAVISIAAWQYYRMAEKHFPAYVAVALGVGWALLVWLALFPRLLRKTDHDDGPSNKP